MRIHAWNVNKAISQVLKYVMCFQVNCVAFSPDFEMMVTGSDDERVRIFNAVSGNLVVKLKGHTGIYDGTHVMFFTHTTVTS